MEIVFMIGIIAAFVAAGSIGALVALRNLKSDWGENFVMSRPSVAPSTVPEIPRAKRRQSQR